jgi:hypothetical protein
MSVADKVISRLILAPVAPIGLMLAAWWGTYGFYPASRMIGPAAITGLAVGVLLDLTLLRRRLDSLFSMGDRALLSAALFYSAGMYGFFMGFPVFNAAIGLAGGYVVARRAVAMGWSRERAVRDGRRVAITMTLVLGALCATTAWLALGEATMGTQLQEMLRLPFPVTRPMIYTIIVAGGSGLLLSQYAGAVLVARRFAPR